MCVYVCLGSSYFNVCSFRRENPGEVESDKKKHTITINHCYCEDGDYRKRTIK